MKKRTDKNRLDEVQKLAEKLSRIIQCSESSTSINTRKIFEEVWRDQVRDGFDIPEALKESVYAFTRKVVAEILWEEEKDKK